MKKRGRRRIRSPEYWRAYYTRKQREWRAAHYWQAYYTRKKREQRAAHRLARKRRKQIAARTVRAWGAFLERRTNVEWIREALADRCNPDGSYRCLIDITQYQESAATRSQRVFTRASAFFRITGRHLSSRGGLCLLEITNRDAIRFLNRPLLANHIASFIRKRE